MSEARTAPTRLEWQPMLAAFLIAVTMIWLAGDPWGRPAAPPAPPPLRLLEPHGEWARFPDTFRWSPVAGAELYEVTVWSQATPEAPLFRQRGPTPELGVEPEPGSAPAPGEYGWEVVAFRQGRPLGRAAGRFVVTP